MGLSKDLRATIERVVNSCMEEELINMASDIENHFQRIESLETEVMRLQVRPQAPQPDNKEAHTIRSEFSKIASYIDKMDLRKGRATSVADLCIDALHELDRLEQFLLRSHSLEAIRASGVANTVIDDVNILSENVQHPRWSPNQLFYVMPKACEDADKLPNEVRVRLFDGDERIDLTMLVVSPDEGLHESVLANAVPIIAMPVAHGMLNVVVPSDVPTEFSNRILERFITHIAKSDDKDRAALTMGNCISFEAELFDVERVPWLKLQRKLQVSFGCRRFPKHGTLLADGITYRRLIDKYGEQAAELCLLGQEFIEATFYPLPSAEEERTPPADCLEQPPSP